MESCRDITGYVANGVTIGGHRRLLSGLILLILPGGHTSENGICSCKGIGIDMSGLGGASYPNCTTWIVKIDCNKLGKIPFSSDCCFFCRFCFFEHSNGVL